MVDTMHVPHVNALLDLRMSTFEPVVTDKNPWNLSPNIHRECLCRSLATWQFGIASNRFRWSTSALYCVLSLFELKHSSCLQPARFFAKLLSTRNVPREDLLRCPSRFGFACRGGGACWVGAGSPDGMETVPKVPGYRRHRNFWVSEKVWSHYEARMVLLFWRLLSIPRLPPNGGSQRSPRSHVAFLPPGGCQHDELRMSQCRRESPGARGGEPGRKVSEIDFKPDKGFAHYIYWIDLDWGEHSKDFQRLRRRSLREALDIYWPRPRRLEKEVFCHALPCFAHGLAMHLEVNIRA